MKLRGVLPTCASGNRHTDHGSDYRTSGEVNLSQLFLLWLGKNLENTNLGRHTRSEEEFQKSCLLKGRFHWRKIELKIEVWHSGNKETLPFLPHSQGSTIHKYHSTRTSPTGEKENSVWMSWHSSPVKLAGFSMTERMEKIRKEAEKSISKDMKRTLTIMGKETASVIKDLPPQKTELAGFTG